MQQEEVLLLDSIDLRNKLIGQEQALDKVKVLASYPKWNNLTVKMAADYFEIEVDAIQKVIQRHKDELTLDGIRAEKKRNLSHIYVMDKVSITSCIPSKAPSATILNRRCVLRIGMLLRDSEVAKQLRTYLLNVEEEATQQQKAKATRGSRWDGKDLILYDRIVVGINEGKTLTQICNEVAPVINETSKSCINRYTQKIKTTISNKELVEKIESNKGKRSKQHLQLVESNVSQKSDESIETQGIEIPTWAESYLNHVVQMNIETNELIKKSNSELKELTDSKIENLEKLLQEKDAELKLAKSRNRKLTEELKQTRAVIASAVKIGVNETIQQTFKMSKNGNLERL